MCVVHAFFFSFVKCKRKKLSQMTTYFRICLHILDVSIRFDKLSRFLFYFIFMFWFWMGNRYGLKYIYCYSMYWFALICVWISMEVLVSDLSFCNRSKWEPLRLSYIYRVTNSWCIEHLWQRRRTDKKETGTSHNCT